MIKHWQTIRHVFSDISVREWDNKRAQSSRLMEALIINLKVEVNDDFSHDSSNKKELANW